MSISHEVSTGDKRVRSENLPELVGAVLVQMRQASSLGSIVRAAMVGLRQVGLALLQQALEERDERYRLGEVVVCCPECQARMAKAKTLYPKQRLTLLGKVEYRRCQYRCTQCKARQFPLDEELQLKPALRGHDEHFANALTLLCTLIPFGKGTEVFLRLTGVSVSTKLARTLTYTIGLRLFEAETARADDAWKKRQTTPLLFEPPPAVLRRTKRHKRVYVMADNGKVGIHDGTRGRHAPKRKKQTTLSKLARRVKRHVSGRQKRTPPSQMPPQMPEDLQAVLDEETSNESGFRDIRALVIFSEQDVAQISRGRKELLRRRIIGHVGSKEEWMKLVHLALHEEGVYLAEEVVIVADGGAGIWELFSDLIRPTPQRRVVQILDWYHAVQKLWALGRLLRGHRTVADRKACAAWVGALVAYLAEGRVSNVLQRLRKISKTPKGAKKTLANTIDYFETHRRRMHYGDFRRRNLIIGSGAIESIHAWVFQARCRLPGMRWSVKGINAMIRLRCSWASGRWDDDFSQAANAPPLTERNLRATIATVAP